MFLERILKLGCHWLGQCFCRVGESAGRASGTLNRTISGFQNTFLETAGHRAKVLLPIAALGMVLVAGCDRGPAVAQARGKVLYKDGSVPQGGVRVVRFEPTANSPAAVRKGASGEIEEDGTFEMYTRRPGDGVHLGEYAVTFAVWNGPMDPTSRIVAKYTTSAMTPYHVTVDDDIDDLSFEIEPL